MTSGLLNPYNFGNRLRYLIDISGIDTTKRGFTAVLSSKLFDNGIIKYTNQSNDENEKAKQRDNVRKRIDEHLKLESADNVSGIWLHRYCDYFKCSSDFLFGYIDLPTHNYTDIHKETGLSIDSLKNLCNFTTYDQGRIRIAIIDYLIQNDYFSTNLMDLINSYYEKYNYFKASENIYIEEQKQIRKKAGNDLYKFIEYTDEIQTIDRHQLTERSNVKDAFHFKVQKEFDTILENLIKYFYECNNKAPGT